MKRDVVFVHGMFMNPKGWEPWVTYFTERGHRCLAPAWPMHEGDPATLRASPPEGLGALTLGAVVDAIAKVIDALDAPPVLVGHSMGGLVVQRLIASGRGAAGVCIDSAAPRGVSALSWSFLKSNLPVVNPFKGDSVFQMSPAHFHYTFCNTATAEESRAAWDAMVLPESRNVARSSGGADGAVDLAKPHAPLLFIAGELDNIIPAALNRKNHAAYTDKGSRRDFKEFPGRTHNICAQAGWQEVAAHVHAWIEAL